MLVYRTEVNRCLEEMELDRAEWVPSRDGEGEIALEWSLEQAGMAWVEEGAIVAGRGFHMRVHTRVPPGMRWST